MWEYGVGATPAGELIDGENEAMDTVVGGPEPEDLHMVRSVTRGDIVHRYLKS